MNGCIEYKYNPDELPNEYWEKRSADEDAWQEWLREFDEEYVDWMVENHIQALSDEMMG